MFQKGNIRPTFCLFRETDVTLSAFSITTKQYRKETMLDFVHLHVHTQYSILDGQASIPRLVDKAVADGMRGMAVTDHGNMMGIKEFFNYVKKVNAARSEEGKPPFKPIFGCEMYVAHRSLYNKEGRADQGGNHLIVLAKNVKGYHNLIKLVSKSWTDGFYMKPRTDHKELEAHSEGLIICSACLAGEVPHKILQDDIAGAEETIKWYKHVFGSDYYLELQRHEVKNPHQRANRETFILQQRANSIILQLAKKYDVKMVCTNDVHFVDEENAEAHDRLICLSTNKDLDDPKRMLYSKQEWFKTRSEMNAIFSDVPDALTTTCDICDQIEIYSIDSAPIMPNFDIPESFGTEEEYRHRISEKELFDEFTRDENGNVILSEEEAQQKIKKLGGYNKLYRIKFEADYLAKLTYEGAKEVYGDPLEPEVAERLKFELHVMKTMGFPGYFLIVQDYINAARHELNVSVGPGRGSAAGSAVAYCLGITQIDPIKYDLLFERFLNPDRISLPDIDVDFDDDGRARVLQWVTQKYGAEKVAHIITYGTMATKLAIKDVARVQKLPLDVANQLCKLIPDRLPEGKDGKTPKMTLPNAIAAIPELQQAEASPDPLLRDTIRYAKMLEGNVRNTGVHACGTIICRDEISDWVPVSIAEDKETGEKLRCTQYEGSVIEETGLIKMDFLGLKTLSVLKEAVYNIKDSLAIDIDINKIPIDDGATFQLYCDGRTVSTFQFESAGMQKYLRELQPSTFEDLIAMNALYRPGPMDYIPDFIDRKQGRKPVEYDIPCMEKYLKDTYGITVYQEQVMLLSRQLANFTRGESDTLRKAMGKKQIEKLNHLYPKFIDGGKQNGHDPAMLEKIWNDWRKFASYAFNKSHATCYSWVAYQTAYLKANFPAQFMAADMTRNLGNITTITKDMDECKSMNIQTLGPDVNESVMKFGVNSRGDIRFGLGAVKGVGTIAAESILNERKQGGQFTSIFDFVQRVNLNACNKRCLESLALSGGFDCFADIKREQYFAPSGKEDTFIEALVKYGQRYQADKNMVQNSLFGDMDTVETATPEIPKAEPWSALERLNKERDLVGIYLSAHPLDEYDIILKNVCNTHVTELADRDKLANRDLTFGGIIVGVRKGMTKSGRPFGIAKIEDYSGTFEMALFGQDWAQWSSFMEEGNTLFINAKYVPRKYNPEMLDLRIEHIDFLADVKDDKIESITITMQLSEINDTVVTDLSTLLKKSPGKARLLFQVIDPTGLMHVGLQSRTSHLSVRRELVQYIDTQPGLSFRIN